MKKTLSLPYRQGDCLSRRKHPLLYRLRLWLVGFPDMGGFIAASVTSFLYQQDNRLSMARDKHLNVWIPYTFPFVCGNCSKPKIGAFTGALCLRKYVQVLFLPIIRRAGGRPSSRPPLLCSIGLWSRSQPSMPLTWSVSWSLILVSHRSSCFLLYHWFQLLGLSIKTSSSDTMPICAFSPETILFLGFASSQGIERERVCGTVCICCCGCCSQKQNPNLQSL